MTLYDFVLLRSEEEDVESRVKKVGVVMRERLVVVRPSVVVVGCRSASINLKPQPSTLSPIFSLHSVRRSFYVLPKKNIAVPTTSQTMRPTAIPSTLLTLLLSRHPTTSAFTPPISHRPIPTQLHLFSAQTRDKQAISGIKSALSLPSPTLIECEFPPLVELNKLGDGSLRSSLQAEDANVAFVSRLVGEIGLPFLGPKANVLVSSSGSNSFLGKVRSKVKSGVYSLKEESVMERMEKGDVCVVLTPSSAKDYRVAKELAEGGFKTVIVNGLFKVRTLCFADAYSSAGYSIPMTMSLSLTQSKSKFSRIQRAYHPTQRWPII
jgi:hypothetical protein